MALLVRTSRPTRLAALLLTTTALTGSHTVSANSQSLPTGYATAYGNVGFQRSSGTLTINQSSQNAIVNYNSFSIGQRNTVNIVQPNRRSVILNRVTGNTPSTIAGHLNANGQVYLINPNGIAITKTGVVKVGGGFIASSLGMSDDEFKHGRKYFKGTGASAAATNAGTIAIGRGGYAALIGGEVHNSGMIAVPMGKVGLGSGEMATLDVSGDGFLQVALATTGGGKGALVSNSGLISAAGGTVVLDAATARAAARNAVNISGTIDAHSISGHNGSIFIGGGAGGSVHISGTLNVANRHGTGGSVTVTGQKIALKHAKVNVAGRTGGGSVRIGGDLHGGGTLAHAGTVTIDAKSRITADATAKGNGGSVVVWSDTSTSFAGAISAKGGARGGDAGSAEVSSHGLLFYTGTTDLTAAHGAMGTLSLDPYNITISDAANSGTPLVSGVGLAAQTSNIKITTLEAALNKANVSLSTGAAGSVGTGAGNITLSPASGATLTWTSSATLSLTAAGTIALNAPISAAAGGLTLNAGTLTNPGAISATGTISLARFTLQSGAFSQIATTLPAFSAGDFELAGGTFVRATAGTGAAATPYTLTDIYGVQGIGTMLTQSYQLAANIDASQTATWYAGKGFAPIGSNDSIQFTGTFDGAGHTIANLTVNRAGDHSNYAGLFGDVGQFGTIENVGVVGGTVRGYEFVGGLVGRNHGTITQSYATSAVNASIDIAGGLVGENDPGAHITQAYATGAVGAQESVGGLVGRNEGTINQAYATGAASAFDTVGAFAGENRGGSISQAYATGAVSVSNNAPQLGGGFAGVNQGVITTSFYDSYTTGKSQAVGTQTSGSAAVTAVTSDPTQSGASNYAYTQSAYAGLTFAAAPGQTGFYMVNGLTRPFLSSEYSATITNSHQLELINLAPIASYTLANNIDFGPDLAAVGGKYPGLFAASGFAPIGGANGVSGTFDGAGHTIANLTINQPNTNGIGLFSEIAPGGLVENVGLVGGTVSGHTFVGSLVGDNQGTLSQVFTTVTVNGTGATIGGLAGGNDNGTIMQAYATGAVTSSTNSHATGGLVGVNEGAITQSYATGAVTAGTNSDSTGGLVGVSYQGGTITQAYATGAVAAGNGALGVGGLVGETFSSSVSNSFYDSYTTGQSQGVGSITGGTVSVTAVTSDPNQTQTAYRQSAYTGFTFVTSPAGAATTPGFYMVDGATRPFLSSEYSTTITNSHQLELINLAPGASYTLANNIDLGPDLAAVNGKYPGLFAAAGFAPIGVASTGNPTNNGNGFTGTFAGGGHTISNLAINRTGTEHVGLFGVLTGATISDLNITNADIVGFRRIGVLVGLAQSGSTISFVNVSGNATSVGLNGSGGSVGGLIGDQENSTVYASSANVIVTGSQGAGGTNGAVGGLVGASVGGTIKQSFATGSVTGAENVGGLVGFNTSTAIANTYATGSVQGGNFYTGGLVGQNYASGSSISASYAVGAVQGTNAVGGLIGQNTAGTISNSYFDVDTTGQAASTGHGATGYTTTQLQDLITYATNYTGFEFKNIWSPPNSVGQNNNSQTAYYPQLYALQHITTVDPTGSRMYNTANSTAPSLYYGVQAGDYVNTLATVTNAATPTSNVGTYLGSTAAGALTTGDGSTTTASGAAYRYVYLPAGTLTVTPAVLDVTGATGINKTYDGTANVAVGTTPYTVLNPVSGVNVSDMSAVYPSRNASTTASINVTGLGTDNTNYVTSTTIVSSSGTISPEAITVTAATNTKTYDGTTSAAATPTVTSGAIQTGDSATFSETYDNANAGTGKTLTPQALISDGNMGNNYTVTYVASATGTINTALLTYVANTAIRTYGAANPTFSGTVTGFVNGQTATTATTGTLTFVTTATSASNVGSYAIDGSGLSANHGNYTFVQAAGNATALTINPATLTYTATAATDTYGTTPSGLTGTVTGFVNGQTQAGATTGTLAFGTPATSASNVGSYAIDGSGLTADHGNYTFVQAAGNATALTINPATLTYTANAATDTYGTTPSGLTGTVTGFVNGQTASTATTGTLAFGTPATSASNVGSYAIDGSGLTADHGNYTFVQAAGNATALTINPATLTYTANAATDTYGTTPSGLTGTVTGFVNGQTASTATTGTLAFGTPATSASNVGSYAIDGSGLSADHGNYTFVQAAANTTALTINPATLTYTANAATDTYGTTPSSLTGTVTGFVNGQTASTATTGTLAFGTTATSASNVGSYAIDGSGLTADHGNYTFVQAAGHSMALTINPATLTYTANAATDTYGTTPSGLTGTVTGFVNGQTASTATTGTLAFGTTATSASNVGSYAIDGSGLSADHGNYTFVQAAANTTALTINPATLTYTANAATDTYGTTPSSLTGTVTGFVNGQTAATATTGTLAFGTTATSASNVGSYAIDGSGLTADHGNYTFVQAASNTTALTINPATLIVSGAKAYDGKTSFSTGQLAVAGAENGETVTLTQGTGTSSSAEAGSHPNSRLMNLVISVAGGNMMASNYRLPATGTLVIDKATITITVAGATGVDKTYDGTTALPNGATGFTTSGEVNNNVTVTASSAMYDSPNAGMRMIDVTGLTLSGKDAADYMLSATSVTGSGTISPAMLTYVANAASRTYGAANPTLSGTVTGFVDGQNPSSATTGTVTFGSTATSSNNVGSYGIDGSGLTANNGNYTFAQAAGNATALAITPARLMVSGTKTYDGTNIFATGQLAVAGAENGETVTLRQGTGTSPSADAGSYANSPLSNLTILVNGGNMMASNYSLPAAGTLVIGKATITVIGASGVDKTYDSTIALPNGATGFTTSGEVNNNVTVTASSAMYDSSNVGARNVDVTGLTISGAAAKDYVLSSTSVTGSGTISPATVTVTALGGTSIYGTSPANPGLSSTGLQGGQSVAVLTGLSNSFGITGQTHVGSYTTQVQGMLTNDNYRVGSTTNGTFTVTPRSLSITAGNESRAYAAANPPLTYTIGATTATTGLVNGDGLLGALATTATQASPGDPYPITQGTLAATADYAVAFKQGTLTVGQQPVTPPATLVDLSATLLASTVDRAYRQTQGDLGFTLPVLSPPPGDGIVVSQIVRGLGDPRFDAIIVCVKDFCTITPPSEQKKVSWLEITTR